MQKQPFPINFAQGLDQKTDPKQIPLGKFFALNNSIFTKAGLLAKRNGFGPLASLPDSSSLRLTTFGGNLTALGSKIEAFAAGSEQWIDKGDFQPISLSVLPLARSPLNQVYADAVTAPNGFTCAVFIEDKGGTKYFKYSIQDSTTGQFIVSATDIPVSSGAVFYAPRVFLLGGYFIIVFGNDISGTSHLQYVSVSVNDPTVVSAEVDISADYDSASTFGSFDGVVVENKLFLAYPTSVGGAKIQITSLSTTFVIAAPTDFAGVEASAMSMCADLTDSGNPVIYAAFATYNSMTLSYDGYACAVDQSLNTVMDLTALWTNELFNNISSIAQDGVCTVLYEIVNGYSYAASIANDYIKKVTVTPPASPGTGTVGTPAVVVRSVGLASKAFLMNDTIYFLAAYDGSTTSVAAIQPTYFLLDLSGHIISRIAYQNGGGYTVFGLPQAQVIDSEVKIPYLFKDLIESVNKSQGVTNFAGVYSQTGVNLATFDFSADTLAVSEIGKNLNISGGFMWAYDGNTLAEQNFHLFPDNVQLTVSHSGGSMTTQDYFYVWLYEWTDAQGNIFRSAPSLPVKAPTADFSGSSNSVTVNVPTLRLTGKTGVKLMGFRWSTAQQAYFQVTSITNPVLNNKAVDSIAFNDTQADSAIAGNSLLYTTGGVLENIGIPACTAVTLFDTRLWFIHAEDQNLLGFTKQVIEATPVEWSDLLTKYIAPNAGAQGDTGPMRCLAPMDDKLVIFKANALYYINGTGPDNTGTNNQYSEPIFITSSVGSVNQQSIVMTPNGLMFQSDKGIWLLTRGLETLYVGAAVENSNSAIVTSAVVVPETTQARFTLNNGTALMFDYYYSQWGTFQSVAAVSSTLYQSRHTYLDSNGGIFQQEADFLSDGVTPNPNRYLDNGNPVLLSFTTGWASLAGLRGFQRLYRIYLLGSYYTPIRLTVGIAYNYDSNVQQTETINPNLNLGTYGSDPIYGDGAVYGGGSNVLEWRLDPRLQKCQSFQITLNEYYDVSLGVPAGAGLDLTGLNIVAGFKKGYAPIRASKTSG